MSTAETKDGQGDGDKSGESNAGPTSDSDAAADDAAAAWPPKEAAPVDEAAPEAPSKAEPPAQPDPAAFQGQQAAMPDKEMGFSDSTLHWLEDGDRSRPTRPSQSITLPSYDPTAPIAGRTRAIFVVGGAAVVALIITGAFYLKAKNEREARPAEPTSVDPARELSRRAEEALAAKRLNEALDLARLAIVADPRTPDPHFIVATCEQARKNLAVAREEYRKYLELAPIGRHSQSARAALAALPP
jgi:hypothetical protein